MMILQALFTSYCKLEQFNDYYFDCYPLKSNTVDFECQLFAVTLLSWVYFLFRNGKASFNAVVTITRGESAHRSG